MVSIGLLAAISALKFLLQSPGQATAMLYLFPIALLAVTFGLRGGLAGAAAGYSLFAIFQVLHGNDGVSAFGWVIRFLAMFLLGILLGRSSDAAAASARASLDEQARRCRLEDANKRYAEAIEISDSILQHMAAAKWLTEQGRLDEADEVLGSTIERGERMVEGLLRMRVSTADRAIPEAEQPGL